MSDHFSTVRSWFDDYLRSHKGDKKIKKVRAPKWKKTSDMPGRPTCIWHAGEYHLIVGGTVGTEVLAKHPIGNIISIPWATALRDWNDREKPIQIFTGGSFKNGEAGYGACIVGHGRKVIDIMGPVLIDPEHEDFIGAHKVSGNTGELSAIALAARHALANFPGKTKIEFKFDSFYAGNVISGRWRPKSNRILGGSARRNFKEAERRFDIDLDHIYSHIGHIWNDRADDLSEVGRSCASLTTSGPEPFPTDDLGQVIEIINHEHWA